LPDSQRFLESLAQLARKSRETAHVEWCEIRLFLRFHLQSGTMTNQEIPISTQQVRLRTAVAFGAPLAGAIMVSLLAGSVDTAVSDQSALAILFAGLGLVSWFIGLRWYGLPGLGLRSHRALYAGIGFAALGWLAFLILRFYFVHIVGFGPANSTRSFIFLLLFEAFAVQIWVYGLLFRALSDWRGALTAAIGSGIIFGAVAYLLFQESFTGSLVSFIYFVLWGIFYGIIRLRTGSIIGTAVIQALHSFTAWVVMVPQSPVQSSELQSLYLAAGAAYLILIWRLWPKVEEDYRV
jgi:hypothetical protein